MILQNDLLIALVLLMLIAIVLLILWRLLAPGVTFINMIKRFTLWELLVGLSITGSEFFKRKKRYNFLKKNT